MTSFMFGYCLKDKMPQFRKFLSKLHVAQTVISRHVFRKYPVKQDESMPVFQYPSASPSDRCVYVWGLSEHGALGERRPTKKKLHKTYVNHPMRHTFAEYNKVVDVTCGYGFTAFAVNSKDKYKLYGCGINTDSQVGFHDPRRGHPLGLVAAPAPIELPLNNLETKLLKVSAGRAHLVALTDNDGVFSLGNNAFGQCGRRIMPDEEYLGSRVVHHIRNLDGETIISVHCGQDHTLFLTASGRVYSCGWGADGQTGLGHYDNRGIPTQVAGQLTDEKIVKLAGSVDCVLALNQNGEVFGWGNNEYGTLGTSVPEQQIAFPIRLKICEQLGRIVDIAAGGTFCMVLNEHGSVFTWGYGILGTGPKVLVSKEPVEIPQTLFGRNEFSPDSKVVSVSCGMSHLAAVTNMGHLFMWGRNKDGCLGLRNDKDQYFPLKVAIGGCVMKVSCGVDHTVALCKSFI